jgi:GntR family transcriptional repressor for pyruvate dehydrogenase complex
LGDADVPRILAVLTSVERGATMALREVQREKLYFSIADQIVGGIRSGEFPTGTALPAERVLAEELGVSRGSVREAIRVLEHAGILEVRMGSGTYVREGNPSKAEQLRVVAAARGEYSPLDIIVARRAIEPVAAGLAARNAQPGELVELRRLIDDQAERITSDTDPEEPDMEFHLAIGRATRNAVIESLVGHIVEIRRQGFWSELKSRSVRYPGERERYLDQHRAILKRIEKGDAPGASRTMKKHVDDIERSLLGELS